MEEQNQPRENTNLFFPAIENTIKKIIMFFVIVLTLKEIFDIGSAWWQYSHPSLVTLDCFDADSTNTTVGFKCKTSSRFFMGMLSGCLRSTCDQTIINLKTNPFQFNKPYYPINNLSLNSNDSCSFEKFHYCAGRFFRSSTKGLLAEIAKKSYSH